MSAFLPDGFKNTSSAVTPLSGTDPSEGDVSLMQRVLSTAAARPQLIPQAFMAQLIDSIQVSNLIIPISQISGFSQFTAQTAAFVSNSETTVSTTYTDLATVGPTITALPDGQYVVLYAALLATNTGGNRSLMAPSVNGAAASDTDAIESRNTQFVTCSGFSLQTLTAGTNSITMKYRSDSGAVTAFAASRRLIVLKYANA